MRRSPQYAVLLTVIALPTCHRKAPAPDPGAVALAESSDAIKEQALKDLQSDVLTLRTQLSIVSVLAQAAQAKTAATGAAPKPGKIDAALYTCERVALASRALADDARAQSLLGEADSMCAYQAPLAAGEQRLSVLEARTGGDAPRSAPADCGAIRDALTRVGQKYKTDAKLAELIRRFKTDCPHVRLGGGGTRVERASFSGSSSSSGSASRGPDPEACRRRCDDTAFSCRAGCQYCGSCTNDKTWEWCNATCNSCKQGCEQNEKFCKASCG
jgi:hypothetical protein